MTTVNNANTHPARSLADYFWVTVRGFCMGAADVVPGVSGGTMAFILGIYDELLHAIHAVDINFIRRLITLRWREAFERLPWRFLLALGLGIGLAILTLAEALSWALHHHPAPVWAFFFGLVLASVAVVSRRVQRWRWHTYGLFALATVGAFVLVGLTPAQTPDAPWFLFLSGAIAICAMILPGISGAFILVLLGKYQYVLDALVRGDIVTLAIVAAGCAAGLLTFVRVLRWLLKRYGDSTVAVLAGFMLGSLRKVWPWKETVEMQLGGGGEALFVQEINIWPQALTPETALAVVLMVAGIGLVWGIEAIASRRKTA